MVQNGQNINDVIRNIKFKEIGSKQLHGALYLKIMNEKDLRQKAMDLRQDLMNGFFDTRESELKYGDRKIFKDYDYKNENGEWKKKTKLVSETINTDFGDWEMYVTILPNGEVDTGLNLRGNIQDALLGPFMHVKEIPIT